MPTPKDPICLRQEPNGRHAPFRGKAGAGGEQGGIFSLRVAGL